MTPARPLRLIHADVINLRAKLRRAGTDEAALDHLWSLVNESFRRGVEWSGVEWAKEQEEK